MKKIIEALQKDELGIYLQHNYYKIDRKELLDIALELLYASMDTKAYQEMKPIILDNLEYFNTEDED